MVRSKSLLGVALGGMMITLGLGTACLAAETASPAAGDARTIEAAAGTYVDASGPGGCDTRATSGGALDATRAVTVVYWRGLLTLRVVPSQTIRVLHIQRRPHLTDVARSDFHNGLAHWEAGDLVVETDVPALPLWSHSNALRAASSLIERFSFSESSLTYRAAYRLLAGSSGVGDPFELTLTKCAVSQAN